jgi:hypothetical protein
MRNSVRILIGNQPVIFDYKDFNIIHGYKWRIRKGKITNYVVSGNNIKMHRILLDAGDGEIVDHINGNGLDNRRSNLRIVNFAQNAQNRGNQRNKLTPKGVTQIKNKFRARIRVKGILIHLGYFTSKKDAAKEYDKAAIKYFGDYARLNNL